MTTKPRGSGSAWPWRIASSRSTAAPSASRARRARARSSAPTCRSRRPRAWPRRPGSRRRPAARAAAGPAMTPARILVADDEPSMRWLLERVLGQAGHSVTVVEDGAGALARAGAEPYDLAFVDVRMPDVDGLEVLSRLRDLRARHGRDRDDGPRERPLRGRGDAARGLRLPRRSRSTTTRCGSWPSARSRRGRSRARSSSSGRGSRRSGSSARSSASRPGCRRSTRPSAGSPAPT